MFIITKKEYNTGVLLNEWNGKLGITYAFQKGDTAMPFWVYRQSPFQAKAISKAMPHRVELGTPKQAKIILQKFIDIIDKDFLEGEETNDNSKE